MTQKQTKVLIAGACVRELVQAGSEEGYEVQGIDLFGDRDSQLYGSVEKITDFAQIPERVSETSFDRWIYCGGIENQFDVIQALGEDRLAGCSLACAKISRDPFKLSRIWRTVCDTVPDVSGTVSNGKNWLWKPLMSAGGTGVLTADSKTSGFRENGYFQKRVSGTPHSAVFFAGRQSTRLVGVTRQIVGDRRLSNKRFTYSGSIGPILIDEQSADVLKRCANEFSRVAKPSAFFGIDFIQEKNEVWPIEVNPRITASLEILRRTENLKLVRSQLENELIKDEKPDGRSSCAKAILYNLNEKPIQISGRFSDWAFDLSKRNRHPLIGDIPWPETIIASNCPILTVYSSGNDVRRVEDELFQMVKLVREKLNSN